MRALHKHNFPSNFYPEPSEGLEVLCVCWRVLDIILRRDSFFGLPDDVCAHSEWERKTWKKIKTSLRLCGCPTITRRGRWKEETSSNGKNRIEKIYFSGCAFYFWLSCCCDSLNGKTRRASQYQVSDKVRSRLSILSASVAKLAKWLIRRRVWPLDISAMMKRPEKSLVRESDEATVPPLPLILMQ